MILQAILLGLASGFVAFVGRDFAARPAAERRPTGYAIGVGAITDFFDTLGIGSFAPSTTLLRARRAVHDAKIPGTLNVGHTLATTTQACIYLSRIEVDRTTLIMLVTSAVLGAFFGAGVVSHWSVHRVRLGMAIALTLAATLMLAGLLDLVPPGGAELGLSGAKLAVGTLACALFGALMTIGIGAYGPILVTVSLLGMNPRGAFPIMMSACAAVMPVASAQFVRADRYSPGVSLGITLGGVPAVFVAAYVVESLPLEALRWLVLIVVVVTAGSLFRAARAAE